MKLPAARVLLLLPMILNEHTLHWPPLRKRER